MKLRYALLAFLLCLLIETAYVDSSASAQAAPKHIDVIAKRFTYEPNELTLKKGEAVDIVLKSVDVAHGIHFKELNLQARSARAARPISLSRRTWSATSSAIAQPSVVLVMVR